MRLTLFTGLCALAFVALQAMGPAADWVTGASIILAFAPIFGILATLMFDTRS